MKTNIVIQARAERARFISQPTGTWRWGAGAREGQPVACRYGPRPTGPEYNAVRGPGSFRAQHNCGCEGVTVMETLGGRRGGGWGGGALMENGEGPAEMRT